MQGIMILSLKREYCHLHLKRLHALASVANQFQSDTENAKNNFSFYNVVHFRKNIERLISMCFTRAF